MIKLKQKYNFPMFQISFSLHIFGDLFIIFDNRVFNRQMSQTWFLRVSYSLRPNLQVSLKDPDIPAKEILISKRLTHKENSRTFLSLNIMSLKENDPWNTEWGYHRNSSGPTYAETYLPFYIVNMFPFLKPLLNQNYCCVDATWRN